MKHLCIVCNDTAHPIFKKDKYTYYQCKHCFTVSTLPLPSPSQIKAHYRTKFDRGNYQLLRRYAKDYRAVYRQMAKFLTDRITSERDLPQSPSLLDIGTFTGEFLEVTHELGFDVYGVELQKEAVTIAQQKFPGKVVQADVLHQKLPQKNFNAISMLGLIEHVPNPKEFIERSYQLLDPDGYLLLQTPNTGSLFARILKSNWPPYAPIEHIHLFSRRSLTTALEDAGFKVVAFKPHVKHLPINYIYQNFKNFGPQYHRLLKPLEKIISKLDIKIPAYAGEMLLLAKKTAE